MDESSQLLPPRGGVLIEDYNSFVTVPPEHDPSHEHHHHAAYAAEATGLLVMAILLLALILIRYWGDIPWNAR